MIATVRNPSITLVGAGPGDPELITLKGVRALEQAEVVLYDALISPELLRYTQRECKLINVGKRRGKHSFTQDEINRLIVFYAHRFTRVVRLKGGDPYVFGRGHEELEFAHKRGVSVHVIPGVSSALSAPASVGIPLTKRGCNESFWVITGTLASGRTSQDMYHAARSSATVIILMGLSRLEEITRIFNEVRGNQEAVAVIQNATLPDQRIVKGNVETISQLVEQNQIGSPAVIVVGKVVNESLLTQTVFTAEHTRSIAM